MRIQVVKRIECAAGKVGASERSEDSADESETELRRRKPSGRAT